MTQTCKFEYDWKYLQLILHNKAHFRKLWNRSELDFWQNIMLIYVCFAISKLPEAKITLKISNFDQI